MSDKVLYSAYFIDGVGQLMEIIFEYKILEYWGEPESQKELKDYFKANHFTKEEPISVKRSEVFDVMKFKEPTNDQSS